MDLIPKKRCIKQESITGLWNEWDSRNAILIFQNYTLVSVTSLALARLCSLWNEHSHYDYISVANTLESTQMASKRQLSVFCGYFILWLLCSHLFKAIKYSRWLWWEEDIFRLSSKTKQSKKEWKTILSPFIYQSSNSNRLGCIINLRNKKTISICCQRIYNQKL